MVLQEVIVSSNENDEIWKLRLRSSYGCSEWVDVIVCAVFPLGFAFFAVVFLGVPFYSDYDPESRSDLIKGVFMYYILAPFIGLCFACCSFDWGRKLLDVVFNDTWIFISPEGSAKLENGNHRRTLSVKRLPCTFFNPVCSTIILDELEHLDIEVKPRQERFSIEGEAQLRLYHDIYIGDRKIIFPHRDFQDGGAVEKIVEELRKILVDGTEISPLEE